MSLINLTHAGGTGDGIMFSSIIKEKYCKEYDVVNLHVPRLEYLFKRLYSDTDNISFNAPSATPHNIEFDEAIAHPSWRQVRWDRNLKEEQSAYDEIVNKFGKDYVISHWRPTDNNGFKLVPINKKYIKFNSPVVNLDHNWMQDNGLNPRLILDYTKVLENAKEIHLYEGSFVNFSESALSGKKINSHLYCRQSFFNRGHVHNKVLQFIINEKWTKNNDWNYIYDEE
jgi:hypothetical protein